MSRMLIKLTSEMSRLEWLRYRQKGIGGSDAAAVLGLSRWKGPIDIWLSKTQEIMQDDGQSEAAYWGTVLEDVVAREFMKRTGFSVRRRNAILMHDEYDFKLFLCVYGGIFLQKAPHSVRRCGSSCLRGGVPDCGDDALELAGCPGLYGLSAGGGGGASADGISAV